MACPYFRPVAPAPWTATAHLPRLTLLDHYQGVCDRDGTPPEAEMIENACALGYAATRCDRFPADGADAIRFSVARETPDSIELVWAVEKDHWPVKHGQITVSRSSENEASTTLATQARAFASAWMRRTRHRHGAAV